MANLKNTVGRIAKNALLKETSKAPIINDLLDEKPKFSKGKAVSLIAIAGAVLTAVSHYLGG